MIMEDINGQSYISTIILPGSETAHYVKDAEAREAITAIEAKEAGWDAKQDAIEANGLLKGDGEGNVSAATAGTDYLAPVNAVADDTTKEVVTAVTQTAAGQIAVTKSNLPRATAAVEGIMKLGATGGADTYGSAATAEQNAKDYADNLISGLGSYLTLKGTQASEAAIKALTTAKVGDVWINTADNSEWVAVRDLSAADATAWEKLGYNMDLTPYAQTADLGDLAFKDTASASYTPAGTVAIDAFTPAGSVTVNAITPAGSVAIDNYTPAGSVTMDAYTPAGSIAMDAYTPAGSVTMDAYTPAGSIAVGEGTANYTPGGSVSAPTLTVTTNNTSVNSITAVGTLPSLSTSVANETLTISFDAGTLPTKGDAVSVATGIATATATAPTFTGTGVNLAFSGTAAAPTGSFTGTEATLTGDFTGTAAAPTGSFSGTQATLTGSFTGTAVTPTASFAGEQVAATGSFTGTADTITVS